MANVVLIGRAVADIWANNGFQNDSRVPFWICSNLNFNGHNCPVQLREPIFVIMSNFVAIGQTFAEMRQFFDFENDRRPLSTHVVTLNELQIKSGSSLFHKMQSLVHCLNSLLPPKKKTDYKLRNGHCSYTLPPLRLGQDDLLADQ